MSTIVQEDRFIEIKDRFANLFNVYATSLNGHKDPALFAYQQRAINRLPELSFPTRRDEDYKYTSLVPALKPAYQIDLSASIDQNDLPAPQLEGVDAIDLVFVNGKLQTPLSGLPTLPEGLEILSVSDALKHEKTKTFVSEKLDQIASEEKNPFVVLNAAFSANGIVIYVNRNKVIERPIHFIHLIESTNDAVMLNPQCWVVAEQSSEVTFIESYQHIGAAIQPALTNIYTQVLCHPNASVKQYRLQNQQKNSFVLTNADVYQDRDSTYSSNLADLGGRIVRNNLSTHLKSEGTSTNFFGIYYGNEQQHIDNQTFIDHAFPHCNSNEFYKGILTDKARGVFNGKVMVRQDAQKTNAFQQNSSLVLSKDAQMDSKPQLEIFADDVRCSHGATIGQLDESSIYYLQTRGLNKDQARSLLQQAFLGEVLELFKLEGFRTLVNDLVEEKLNR